jgi:hypothetical protein
MRVLPDGSGRAKVADAPGELSSMYVSSSGIYAAAAEPASLAGVYLVQAQGGEARRLTHAPAGMVNMEAGRVYYMETLPSGSSLMSMSEDGLDIRPVPAYDGGAPARFYTISNGHIYFIDAEGGLCRADIAGGDAEQIAEGPDISAVNISGRYIYCVAAEPDRGAPGGFSESVTRYSLRGEGEKVIADGLMPGSPVNIVDGRIYFFEPGEEPGTSALCSVSVDGTGKEVL